MQIPIPIILQPLTQWLQYSNSHWKFITEDLPEIEWIDHVLWDVLLNLDGKARNDFYRLVLDLLVNDKKSLTLFQKIGLMDNSGEKIKPELLTKSCGDYIKIMAKSRLSKK